MWHVGDRWSSRVRVVAGAARGRSLGRRPEGSPGPPAIGSGRRCSPCSPAWTQLEGRAVVDLFAGSGALGIEALSRGAAACHLVDARPGGRRRPSASNLGSSGRCAEQATVVRADVCSYAWTAPPSPTWSWRTRPTRSRVGRRCLAALAGRTGTLVAETASRWDPGPGWETVKVKRYGGTVVTVVQPVAPTEGSTCPRR